MALRMRWHRDGSARSSGMPGNAARSRGTSAPAGRTFVTALALSMGVGPLLMYGLTALGPVVIGELDLSRLQFGSLATTAFVSAAVSSAFVGVLVDRANDRTTMTVLFVGSALALYVAAAARDYAWLICAVILSGGVQALSNPVTNRLISRRTHASRRGTTMGIKQSGVQVAQAFAGLALPLVAVVVGWRGALVAASAMAVIGMVLAARTLVGQDAPAAPSVPSEVRRPLPSVVTWLAAYAFLSGCALQATNVYLPLYGYERLGMSMPTAGLLAAVIGCVGLMARVLWGRLVNRRESPRAALAVLALGAAVGVTAILFAEDAGSALAWAGAAVFAATGIAANVVLMVSVLQMVPGGSVGRASGTLAIGLYLGFASGPLLFGALVDATHSYRIAWLTVGLIYLVSGAMALARTQWGHVPAPRTTTA